MSFNFMSQINKLLDLLEICETILPSLSQAQQLELKEALCEFEKFGVPIAWSLEDVDADDTLGLNEDEKRIAINMFIENYQPSEQDWILLAHYANDVHQARTQVNSLDPRHLPT